MRIFDKVVVAKLVWPWTIKLPVVVAEPFTSKPVAVILPSTSKLATAAPLLVTVTVVTPVEEALITMSPANLSSGTSTLAPAGKIMFPESSTVVLEVCK